MRRSVQLIGLLAIGGLLYQAEAQQGPEKPDAFLDPDHDVYFLEKLDSIVQYSLGGRITYLPIE